MCVSLCGTSCLSGAAGLVSGVMRLNKKLASDSKIITYLITSVTFTVIKTALSYQSTFFFCFFVTDCLLPHKLYMKNL